MKLPKISHNELNEILEKHKKWLKNEPSGERAYLAGANLADAYLAGANLAGANLAGAELADAKHVHFSLACPSNGGFTARKKGRDNRIVELYVQADAKRLSAATKKCRCDKAVVVSIRSIDESENFSEAISSYDSSFVYRVGETVSVENFDENRWNECSTGIHSFIDREEAVRY